MKSRSIKKTLPRLITWMMLILILLILPANMFVQLMIQHQGQADSAQEMFAQLEQLIETNQENMEREALLFKEKCIEAADMAAYFTMHDRSVMKDADKARELAEILTVDEVHFFTPDGRIFAGSNPEYYDMTFYSGEQMMGFLPMLEDQELRICQDILPNTAEGKYMQYAAVWLSDGSGIVQIGVEARRGPNVVTDQNLQSILSELPLELQGGLHIVDPERRVIVASTDEELNGLDLQEEITLNQGKLLGNFFWEEFRGQRFSEYSRRAGEYVFVRTYPVEDEIHFTVVSTLIVLCYIAAVAIGVLLLLRWYINRKMVRNLLRILEELQEVEKGRLDYITFQTGVTEFDQLIHYINRMLSSILSNWKRLAYIMDRGNITAGILEKNRFYATPFFNRQLLEILGIKQAGLPREELAALVQETLQIAEQNLVSEKEHIYAYDRAGARAYLKIEKQTDEQSVIYYVTDVSFWWEEIYRLRDASELDMLTKLFNRRGFYSRMDSLFLEPESIQYGLMAILDADDLKKVNDLYGHKMGDLYLEKIAGEVRCAVGEKAICARIGGDEFAVFVYGLPTMQEAENAEKAMLAVRGGVFAEQFPEVTERIQFSVGTALYPREGVNYQELMRIADERMYQEKRIRKGKKGEPGPIL